MTPRASLILHIANPNCLGSGPFWARENVEDPFLYDAFCNALQEFEGHYMYLKYFTKELVYRVKKVHKIMKKRHNILLEIVDLLHF